MHALSRNRQLLFSGLPGLRFNASVTHQPADGQPAGGHGSNSISGGAAAVPLSFPTYSVWYAVLCATPKGARLWTHLCYVAPSAGVQTQA